MGKPKKDKKPAKRKKKGVQKKDWIWSEALSIQMMVRMLETELISHYMTEPARLDDIRGGIQKLHESLSISAPAKCGGDDDCAMGWKCCKDGFCRPNCDFGPSAGPVGPCSGS